MDARSLIDAVAKKGRSSDPSPTIIKAVLPKGVRFARLDVLPKPPDAAIHDYLVARFGPLLRGWVYLGEIPMRTGPLWLNHLLDLLIRGECETGLFMHTRQPGEGYICAMPQGTTLTFRAENCGINRDDLIALGEQMVAHEASRAQTAAPAEASPAPSQAQAQQGPLPLPTGHVAHCFAGLKNWDEKKWKTNLGKMPKWLEACLETPGSQGGNVRHWNPVKIAAALVNKHGCAAKTLRARFQTNPLMQPWLEAWNTYEDEYLNTD